MTTEKKFIFVDGVMKANPKYNGAGVSTAPKEQLRVVSTMDEIMQSSEAQAAQTGTAGQLSTSMISSLEMIMDEDYLKQFNAATNLDGGALVEQLSQYFARYETPIGLLNKILALQMYKLIFIVDDSGSMASSTDVYLKDACSFVKGTAAFNPATFMTRWQEAENRLHIFVDIVSFIPTKGIKISFMNSSAVLNLVQDGKSPDQFKAYAHDLIHTTMTTSARPSGGTPTYRVLSAAFNEAAASSDPHNIYFFTDGVPSDRSTKDVSKLVVSRPNPQHTPLTFLTCTDQTSEAQWMKDVRFIFILSNVSHNTKFPL
jgi:hypothetical protein